MEKRDLDYIIKAHNEKAKKPENKFRKWDNKTPYYIHPIWCAITILNETSLPENIRREGSQALLYHDILEDTTAELPEWLSKNVKLWVKEMTFNSSEDEWKNLWDKDKIIKLLKLYDKTNNQMDNIWMKPERKKEHKIHLFKLVKDVESNYGNLNIIKLAKTFL